MSQIFSYQDRPVRTYTENNETWFAAKDVFKALNIVWNGAKTLASIPDSWQRVVKLPTLRNGLQSLIVINEAATYKLAFRSSKPETDGFTNWVASEVLPSIRKTGKFETRLKALPRARQKALPPAVTVSPLVRDLEDLLYDIDQKRRELDNWIYATNHEYSRLANKLFQDVCRSLPQRMTCLDPGIDCLHLARNSGVEKLRDGMGDLYSSARYAMFFARAMRA